MGKVRLAVASGILLETLCNLDRDACCRLDANSDGVVLLPEFEQYVSFDPTEMAAKVCLCRVLRSSIRVSYCCNFFRLLRLTRFWMVFCGHLMKGCRCNSC